MKKNSEEWLIEQAGKWYGDFNRFVAEAFPWGEPPFDVVVGCDGWRKRFPNCKYGLDKWAFELGEALSAEVRKRKFDGKHAVKPIRIAVSSGHGIGKAIEINEIVDTPRGKRRWESINYGSWLWGPDGKPTRVVGVPFDGVCECYRVTLDDGTSTVVSGEHLWTVQSPDQRCRGKRNGTQTLSTVELLARGLRCNRGATKKWRLPRIEPVQYPERKLPVHPYVMGSWIGDGTVGQGWITTDEPEAAGRFKALGYKLRKIKQAGTATVYQLLGIRKNMIDTGIFFLKSCRRYIPDMYLEASVEQRLELLRGLIDTDGSSNNGSITYSTTSEKLADDICWLVRSLGGRTRKRCYGADVKNPSTGIKEHVVYWRMHIALPKTAFYAYSKKQTRFSKTIREYRLHRFIDKIEPVGPRRCKCVTVDRPDGLFLANDFIVTHNSFLTGLIVWWIMSTRPDCKGTITATTMPQLEAKTWAQIAALQKYCLTGHWFEITQGKGSMRFYAKDARESWQCTAQTSKEENSESFAGQHAASSTSFYVVDEASGIPNKIWEVAEGGLTDGEPMIFAFGNPTKASGGFYDCFHKDAARWIRFKVDSREAQLTNKEQIKEWAETYGEDSDFFKVRVKGEFPDNASVQFIPTSAVEAAMSREAPGLAGNSFKRAIVGLDIARFGDDASVIATRIGRDAVSVPMKEIRKMDGPHVGQALAAHCNYLLDTLRFKEVRIYFDRAGVGASVWDWLRYEYNDPRVRYYPVDFGSKAQKSNIYINKRIEMWGRLKEWLITGGGVIPRSEQLKTELISPEYSYNDRQQMVLERKKDLKDRIGCSPDHVDALALTFAEENADVVNDDAGSSIRRYRRMQDLDPTLALDREDAGW